MELLKLNNVSKVFPIRRGLFGRSSAVVHAVNGVTLSVAKGETLGLVGESGCGKSTLGKLALGLCAPTSGEVFCDRGNMQAVFQDPFSSLNPRMSVADIVVEPLVIRGKCSGKDKIAEAKELFRAVGLNPEAVHRYPHEFSGGQRQRICIARAVAVRPKLIVADEPVSSLDVAVQADILNLLKKLQGDFGIAYLFISHDLRVVGKICDRIAVMYLGKIMELLPASALKSAVHPYTKALLSAVPVADPKIKTRGKTLCGDVPSPVNLPKGCVFCGRCPVREDVCETNEPVLEEKRAGHFAACHFWEKI